MRTIKFSNLKSEFHEYLIEQGLSESTPSGHRSTAYDYTLRIERICEADNTTWLDLAQKIVEFISLYDTGGMKESEGQRSNRAPINALKWYSVFCKEFDLIPMKIGDKLLIVDLFSGTYNDNHMGHELFNNKPNPKDGYYYGYVPDYDNPNIEKLGAIKSDKYVNNVLVVFVSKISESNKNRIITGFYPSARVYRKGKGETVPNRTFKDMDGTYKVASYSLFSKSYMPVDTYDSLEIEISKYSSHMFRKQRIYQGKYPELDEIIFSFINNFHLEVDDDDTIYQNQIEKSEKLSADKINESRNREIELQNSSSSKVIKRDPRLAKTAIINADFKCQVDKNHTTFKKTNGEQYMEGHHLIPCTFNNAIEFMEKYNINIDCSENIVSICPNCHRAIHYGDDKTKLSILEVLFNLKRETFNETLSIALNFDDIKKYYL